MTPDQPRCEPPAGLRERELHVLTVAEDRLYAEWRDGNSWRLVGGDIIWSPEALTDAGYRYLMPCPTPEEIAALVSAGRAVVDFQWSNPSPHPKAPSERLCRLVFDLAAALARFPQTGERG